MEIQQIGKTGFRILANDIEISALLQCIREATNPHVVREFEKRIGVSKEEARQLLNDISKTLSMPSHIPGTEPSPAHELADGRTLEISARDLRTVRNCVYEVCNGIRLYEFGIRVGVELDDALTMLKKLTFALKS